MMTKEEYLELMSHGLWQLPCNEMNRVRINHEEMSHFFPLTLTGLKIDEGGRRR